MQELRQSRRRCGKKRSVCRGGSSGLWRIPCCSRCATRFWWDRISAIPPRGTGPRFRRQGDPPDPLLSGLFPSPWRMREESRCPIRLSARIPPVARFPRCREPSRFSPPGASARGRPRWRGIFLPSDQCLKWRMPVKSITIPFSSAFLIESSSRIEPPGCTMAATP